MSSSGYLDDASPSGPPVLISHLARDRSEQQPYIRRISPQDRAPPDIDSVDEDNSDDQISFTTWDSEEEERMIQQEWEETVRQFQLAIQVMLLPYVGKWLGRRWSYWAFTRYQLHGFSSAFFGLDWLWAPNTLVPSAAVAAVQP